jgi:uncharacterized membrane protein YjgN (DUF898 family)
MKSILKNIYYFIVGFLIFAALWNVVPQPKTEPGTTQHPIEIPLGVILFVVIVFLIVRGLR